MCLHSANFFRWLARLTFAATIVLIPFRARVVVQPRPLGTVYGDYTDFLLFASDLFVCATLALWLASLALQPRHVRAGTRWLSAPLVALTAVALASVMFSVDPPLSAYHALRLLLLLAFYVYVVNEVRTLQELLAPLAAQVVAQATVAVAQVLAQHSLGWQALGELPLDPAQSGISIVLADGVRSLRAYGLSDHPNILGGSLAFALLLLAGAYGLTRARMLVGAVCALGVVALFLTFSRAAWLALGGGLLLCLCLLAVTRQRESMHVWLRLSVACVLLLVPWTWLNAAQLGVRFNQQNAFAAQDTLGRAIEGRSLDERSVLNNAALQLFAAHPLTGIGLGALPTALHHTFPDFPYYYQPAHLVLLDVAAETGVVGALCDALLLVAPWLALWRNRARITWTPALVAASGALLAASLVGFFDYYTWLLAPGRLWQWLLWSVWAALYSTSFGEARDA